MRELFTTKGLKIGDVVQVTMRCSEPGTRKPYDWRFFLVLTQPGFYRAMKGHRIGADDPRPMMVTLGHNITAYFLDPDEWPDGVHAFRARAILEGRLEGLM